MLVPVSLDFTLLLASALSSQRPGCNARRDAVIGWRMCGRLWLADVRWGHTNLYM